MIHEKRGGVITWEATLSDGRSISGPVENGSWKLVQAKLDAENVRLVSLKLLGAGIGSIDSNCDGYFIGQRIMAQAFSGSIREMVGIGYWKKNSNVVRIKWYNRSNLDLMTVEAKPVSECGRMLVKNPKTE